jgi:DNA replication protein DnaC
VYSNILRVDVLILDDLGLVGLSTNGAQDLYEIIRDRYERKSIIITSNRAPEEWAEVFGNLLLDQPTKMTRYTITPLDWTWPMLYDFYLAIPAFPRLFFRI